MRVFALLVISLSALLGAARADEITAPLGLPQVPAETAGTPQMRRLGEKLFFDRSLSANGTLSCAMCHIPAQGYASNQSALSIGMEGRALRRNAPSLYNVVFKTQLFHDGRETDLGAQVWGPLLASDEMGNPGIGPLLTRIAQDKDYGPAFKAVFPGEDVTMATLGRAIAAYEATLLKGDSRFDRAFYGGDRTALSAQEWRGYDIFVTKGGCVACHEIGATSALFADQSWHDTGVAFRRQKRERPGVELAPGVTTSLPLSTFVSDRPDPRSDLGRFEITKNPADRWAFITPSLRGVKDTWPYMHDGSLATLELVVDFYDKGCGPNPNLDPRLKPLSLSTEEKAALVAFLKAL
ncbi:MAG: cytochrome c peroxidase [Methylocystis sp.]